MMRRLPYMVILLTVILSYIPNFTGEFILDDKPLVEQNQYITHMHSIQSYLSQEDGASDETGPGDYHTGYYRPLINLSYWLDYQIWGMWAPGFRTTNLILHILCCLVLYHLLSILTHNPRLALWPVLIFAIHPVNTEAVSWVTSRNNILATLFALSAYITHIRAREKKNRTLLLILSTMFFCGAILSKEFGIMLVPILILYRIIMIRKKLKVMEEAVQFLPFIITLALYFILKQKATSSWLAPEGFDSVWTRIYFTPYLIASNLKMILLPFNLHSIIVKYPEGYLNWQILFGMSTVLLILFLTYRFRRNKLAVYGVCSFLMALFPVLNIVSTSAVSLFSMRWLYFPMAFMMPALIAFIQKPLQEKKSLTIVILTAIIVYLGTYTIFLNKGLWHDEKVFFETEINKFNNTYYAYGLALTHLKNKNIQEADKYFRIAVTGYHSKRAKTLIDYAAFLNDTGRFNDALIVLKKANIWQIWPGEKEEWYRNMGTAYIHLGKSEKALPYLKLAAAYGPDEWLNWANLGAGFGTMGMYSESESALKKGLQIKPGSIRLRKNLAKTYVHLKEYDKAISILSAISPDVLEENVGLQMLMKKAQEGLAEQAF